MAPLLPKLRGYFAEFLNNASSVGLRILSSSTCVGLRYGPVYSNSSFSRVPVLLLRYPYVRSASAVHFRKGFCLLTITLPCTGSSISGSLFRHCHHSSVYTGYRNINLLSIGYVSPPRLRPRLPQGRSALPWKPWIFSHKDSHLILATHSGILSSMMSTLPYGLCFVLHSMLPYQSLTRFHGFGVMFQPRYIFGAGTLD
jgi:hypothetical protein